MVISRFTNNFIKRKLLESYISKGGDLKLDDIENFTGTFKSLDTDNKKGMFTDFFKMGSLLFNKIDIKDVIDFEVDISDFKTNAGQLTSDYHLAQTNLDRLNKLNSLTELKVENRELDNGTTTNFSQMAIKKFNTFIKLVGLTEITITDVYLVESENKLYIELSPEHPIYTGSLEIKTW